MVKTARGGFVTGATATTKINRLEYGLEYNNMVEAGPVVGDEVTITIDIEANRPSPPGQPPRSESRRVGEQEESVSAITSA